MWEMRNIHKWLVAAWWKRVKGWFGEGLMHGVYIGKGAYTLSTLLYAGYFCSLHKSTKFNEKEVIFSLIA